MDLTAKQISDVIRENPRAMLVFYSQVYPFLVRFLQNKINNQEDREELIQDIILAILDSLPQFKAQAKFKTWVYTIAKHELIDYYRKKKIKNILFSHFPFLEKLADMALGPELALEEKQAKQKIFETLKNLSEGYAQILRLRYIEGLSVQQIADKLDISYKAAESRLGRARLAFQKEFVFTTANLSKDS
ncbi:sigma-70 family RNA polymerase sigma factor [Candidatus Beckwithbacteria bacterium]|nr:sigma-70 family RNA polymerase sigma factor [Candidatus Beckwithbacteria bacterium]